MPHTSNNTNILISACLLGNPVRYDGTDLLLEHPLIKIWQKQKRLISICPEIAGGMPTPRAPAEICLGDGNSVLNNNSRVINNNKQDVTKAFVLGAHEALRVAQNNNCTIAILTERSPSCASQVIYDGSFTGIKKAGIGVTSALLEKHNIKVFNQYQLEKLSNLFI